MASTMSTTGIQMTAALAVQSQGSLANTSPLEARPALPAAAAAASTPATAASAAAGTPAAATPAAGTPASGPSTPSPEESAKQLAAAVQSLQTYLLPDRTATLQVDKDSGQTYVRIMDAKTKQTILQIPPPDALAMAQKLQKMANPQAGSGVLVDQQG